MFLSFAYMPIETRSNSDSFRRTEQLKRWKDSETNQVSSVARRAKTRKIKFSDECIFLSACAAGDTEEVEHLLEKGTDINIANIDGLTALHQACIGNNLEMVQFLIVKHGCDVNRGDNEGWTPLHTTASCGFITIAKFLVEHGANIAAVNNDGMLPIDIAESNEMKDYLTDVLDEQGIDCVEARSKEERMMLEDAKEMLNSNKYIDNAHPSTGATALHVAAAKGYIQVINILIQLGADLDAQDIDGWTPLHAAAYWGQKEACALLADNLCNMDIQNFAGQTCFSTAEPDVLELLEELKKKQASIQKERQEIQAIFQRTSSKLPMNKTTFVTRMSNQEKNMFVLKDTKSEIAQIENLVLPEETKEKKKKIRNDIIERLSNAKKDEKEIIPKKVSVTELKSAEIHKEPELKRIPSWKQMLRKASGNSESHGSKISQVTFKHVKKSKDNTENNGPSPDAAKEGSISSGFAPLHQTAMNTEAVNESSSYPTTLATPKDSSYESLSQEKWRSFISPVTDDEPELRKKAHAKRVHELRCYTPVVLLEDIKSAGIQFLMNTEKEAAKCKAKEMQTVPGHGNNNEKEQYAVDIPEANISKKDKILKVGSEDKEKASIKYQSSESASSENVPSGALAFRVKPSSSLKDTRVPENRSSFGTQAAIQTRKRPKRTYTGVVYLDRDDGQEERENSKGTDSNSHNDCDYKKRTRHRYCSSNSLPDLASEATSRSETPSHYSSISFRSNLNDDNNKDYKKLYEKVILENKRLNDSLKKTEEELKDTKKQLNKLTHKTDEIINYKNSKGTEILHQKGSINEAEKKERGALEQKISGLEEELKQYERLKAVSERLREEKSSLIRVISKLSQYCTFNLSPTT